MHSVYDNIRTVRNEKGYSQEYMANRLSIKQSNYGKLERGIVPLTIERVEQIAKIFELPVAELITDSKTAKNKRTGKSDVPVGSSEKKGKKGLSEIDLKQFPEMADYIAEKNAELAEFGLQGINRIEKTVSKIELSNDETQLADLLSYDCHRMSEELFHAYNVLRRSEGRGIREAVKEAYRNNELNQEFIKGAIRSYQEHNSDIKEILPIYREYKSVLIKFWNCLKNLDNDSELKDFNDSEYANEDYHER